MRCGGGSCAFGSGGTGPTGPFALRRLHALGHEVTVFHRGVHDVPLPASVRYIQGRLDQSPRELTHPEPDVVVHTWALIEAKCGSIAVQVSRRCWPCRRDLELRCLTRLRVFAAAGSRPARSDSIRWGRTTPRVALSLSRQSEASHRLFRGLRRSLVEQTLMGRSELTRNHPPVPCCLWCQRLSSLPAVGAADAGGWNRNKALGRVYRVARDTRICRRCAQSSGIGGAQCPIRRPRLQHR